MYNYTKPNNIKDLDLALTELLGNKFDYFNLNEELEITVYTKEVLTQEEEDSLANLINNYDRTTSISESVSPRQLRTALVLSGVSEATVDNIIDSMPEPNKSVAKIAWQFASVYERSNALVNQLGLALSLSETQIDDIWILAASL